MCNLQKKYNALIFKPFTQANQLQAIGFLKANNLFSGVAH